MNQESYSLKAFKKSDHADSNMKFSQFISPVPKISRQYLRLKAFLNSRQKRDNLFRSKQKKFPEQKVITKYFGKKVTYVNNSSKLLTSSGCYKYLKSITFTENENENCMYEAMIKSRIYEAMIKSLVDLVIFNQNLTLEESSFLKIVSRLKPSTKSESFNNFESWVSIPEKIRALIKHQNLKVGESAMPWQKNKEEDSVEDEDEEGEGGEEEENEDRDVEEDGDEDSEDNEKMEDWEISSASCRRIVRKNQPKKLKKRKRIPYLNTSLLAKRSLNILQLDLAGNSYWRYSNFREASSENQIINVLLDINQLVLTQLHLRVSVSPRFLKNLEELKPILEKVDLLGLDYKQDQAQEYRYNTVYRIEKYRYPTKDMIEMKHLFQNKKKVLEIYTGSSFSGFGSENIDMFEILNCCKSLKALYIKSVADPFMTNNRKYRSYQKNKDGENEVDKDESYAWTSNLTDLVLSFNYIYGGPHKFFDEFYSIIRRECHNLKTLELFEYEDIKEEDRTSINMETEGLEEITSLEELRLSTNGENMEYLREPLLKLQKLRKLCLDFKYAQEASSWDEYFPFDCLGNIKELRIKIYPDYKSEKWGERFIKKIHYLENLEALEIIDSSDNGITMKSFFDLIENLTLLKNLRSLDIKTTVTSLSSRYSEPLPEALEVCVRNKEEELLNNAKEILQSFFNSNKHMDRFYLGELEGFSFECIQFTNYKNTRLRRNFIHIYCRNKKCSFLNP